MCVKWNQCAKQCWNMKFSFYKKSTLFLLAFVFITAFWKQWSIFREVSLSVRVVGNATVESMSDKEKEAKLLVDLQRRMDSRLDYIKGVCNSGTVDRFKDYTQMKMHPEVLMTLNGTGICMCKVPKASSTFFGKALLLLRDWNKTDEIKGLSGFDIHGRMFATYGEKCDLEMEPAFFVTRNPYTRLFSGYIDKIFVPKFWRLALSLHHFSTRHNQTVLSVNKYIEAETAKGDCYKDNISFDLFLRYVFATRVMDAHFTPVSMLCDPCKLNYTAVIKQEYFKDETMFMLKSFGVKPEVQAAIEPLLERELVERSVQNLFDTVRQISELARITHGCKIPFLLYLRVWQAVKILGYVDSSEPFPFNVFSKGLKGAYERLKANNIRFLNSTQRKKQRYDYLKQAYKSVSQRTIQRIQKLFQLDFLMFGYNTTPPA